MGRLSVFTVLVSVVAVSVLGVFGPDPQAIQSKEVENRETREKIFMWWFLPHEIRILKFYGRIKSLKFQFVHELVPG